MKEKKFTPLMWCHLILMAVLAIISVVTAVILLKGATSASTENLVTWKTSIITTACFNLVNMLALGFGIIYLLKGYRKNAAVFYKTFILITAAATVLYALTIVFMMQTGNFMNDTRITSNALYILGIIFMAVKFILLLVLSFGRDLGKRNTWIVFCVILALDLIFALFYTTPGSVAAYRFVAVLPRLFMDGTIGLAIKGKYDDKDARGTV